MGEKAYVLSPMFSPRASAVASAFFKKYVILHFNPHAP